MESKWIDEYIEAQFEGEDVPVLEPREYLDDAVVGVAERFQDGAWRPHLVYDYDKLIEALAQTMEPVDEDDDPYTMALEWYSFNTYRGIPYMGPNQPSIVVRRED